MHICAYFRRKSHGIFHVLATNGHYMQLFISFFGQQDPFHELRLNIIQGTNTAQLTSQLPIHISDSWAPPDLTGRLFLQPAVCLESIFLSFASASDAHEGCSEWWHLRLSRHWTGLD